MRHKEEKRTSNTSPLKNVIEDLLKSYKIKDKFDENRLITNWEQIMGTPIAKRTENIYIKNKVLYAKINSPALRQELNIAKKKVLDLLHEHVDSALVKDVKFV